MKKGMILMTLGAGALIVAACSATTPVKGAAAGPESSVSSPRGQARWTASIRSVFRDRFDAPDSSRAKSYGTAEWRPGDRPGQSNISVSFSYGGAEKVLSWAILFGNCGIGSMTLSPLSTFPELEITGGNARVEATMLFEFATSGTYHIDIYGDRQGTAESVVGCGNLRYSAG